MKEVLVKGEILGTSGYASHTRGLIEGLVENGVKVMVEAGLNPVWDRDPNLSRKVIDSVRNKVNPRAPVIMVAQPYVWIRELSNRPEKFYGCLVFEGDKIPKSWVRDCNDPGIDGIFVPSKAVEKAAYDSGVITPIHVISHGINPDIFKGREVSPEFEKIRKPQICTFLFAKGWVHGVNDRSGFDILVRAFVEEFKNQDDVRLLAYVNKAYNPPSWDFGLELEKLKLPEFDKSKIVYLPDNLTNDKMCDLYICSDLIVSASKAEGFNLPILEAMACGTIPIVPDGSAEIDYVDEINGFVYETERAIPAFPTNDVLFEGINWRLPSLVALKKKLREGYDTWKTDTLRSKRPNCMDTSSKLTWKNNVAKMLEVIKSDTDK